MDWGVLTMSFYNEKGKINQISASLADNATYTFNNTINVKMPFHGLTPAKGDGVTDDTEALQAIFNYATTNKLSVYFPSGTYIVTNTIHLSTTMDGITIRGDSRNLSVIQNNADVTTLDFQQSGIVRDIYIRDLKFIGVPNAVNVSSAINLKSNSSYPNSSKCYIENVDIRQGYNGITFDTLLTSSFKNVVVALCKNDGFVGTTSVTSTLFQSCYCIQVGRYGYNTMGSYTTFQNCACDSAGSDAYHITGGRNINFIACDAEFLNGNGIYVASTDLVTITGCNITNVPGNYPLIYLQDSGLANISNLLGLYNTASTVSPITLSGATGGTTAGNQEMIQRTSGALPRTWGVRIFHNDGSSYTYAVGYSLIL